MVITIFRSTTTVLLLISVLIHCFFNVLVAEKADADNDNDDGNGSDDTIQQQTGLTTINGEEGKRKRGGTQADKNGEDEREQNGDRRKETASEKGDEDEDKLKRDEYGKGEETKSGRKKKRESEKEIARDRKEIKKKSGTEGNGEGARETGEQMEEDRQWEEAEEKRTEGGTRRRRTDEQQQTRDALDTAPPDVAVPQLSSEEDGETKISDQFLRKLSAQQVADRRARLHRGGNLRIPVDFEEAVRVTVPYQTKLF